jgi:hypothetical protein
MYVRGLDADVLDPTARHVLVVVATHANRSGRAWPSMTAVAAETGLCRKTVWSALTRIETAGLIKVIHRPGATSQICFPHLCNPDPYLCNSRPDLCKRYTRKQPETAKETHAGASAEEVQAAIDVCPYCDDHGWLEWPDGSVGRCSHRVVRRVTDLTVDDILDQAPID